MIEMIFVIVVLGILAAIAVPKFAATRTDAEITKGRADIASIRSAIITERQARLIVGSNSYIPIGTGTYTVNGTTYKQIDNGGLFGGLLMYPIANSATNGHWSSSASGTYIFKILDSDNTFDYNATSGRFDCTSGTYCSDLTH
jgi:general secretion pathway protein G